MNKQHSILLFLSLFIIYISGQTSPLCTTYVNPAATTGDNCADSTKGCNSVQSALQFCKDSNNVLVYFMDGDHTNAGNLNINYLNQSIVYQAVNAGKATIDLKDVTVPLLTISDTQATNSNYKYYVNFNMTGINVSNGNYQTIATTIIQSNVNNTIIKMYIDTCSFSSNNASQGGVFNFVSKTTYGTSDIFIINSQFDSNTAVNGSVLYSSAGHNIYVRDSTFTSNNAAYNGLLFLQFSQQVIVQNCTFSKNSISRGALLMITLGTNSPVVQKSTFDQNIGGGFKAGAIAYFMCTGISNYNKFTNNVGMGGILVFTSQYTQILNSVFSNNSVPNFYGAGVYFEQSYVRIASSQFVANSAGYGGAISGYMDSTLGGGTSYFTDLTVSSNKASQWGGAFYLSGVTVNMTNLDLSSNTATNGSNLYCSASTLSAANVDFNITTQTTFDNAYGINCGSQDCDITDSSNENLVCGVPEKKKSGLTTGQKAGIAIGVIAGVFIILVIVVVLLRRWKRNQ